MARTSGSVSSLKAMQSSMVSMVCDSSVMRPLEGAVAP
jgi:hypothetical protein